jgi:hypothetical protein
MGGQINPYPFMIRWRCLLQVTNGKNRMPAFDGRLTQDEITNVGYYVVEQAQAGWNKNPRYVQYPSKYVSSKLADAYANAAKPKPKP